MKKTTLFAAAIALVSAPVFAGQPMTSGPTSFSYDFIDADWLYQGFDDDLDNGNGWSIAGSKSIGEAFFVNAGYAQLDSGVAGLDINIDRITVGGGWHTPLADRIDLVASAAGVYTDVDGLPGDLDEWGYSVGLGIRAQLLDNLELFTNAAWVDSLNDGQVEATVGVILQLTDALGLRVGGRFVDDSNQLFVGGRLYY